MVLASFDPYLLAACSEICKQIKEDGDTPVIILFDSFLVGSPHTFDSRILRLAKYRTPKEALEIWAASEDISILQKQKISSAIEIPEELDDDLASSVVSAVATFTRSHVPNFKSLRVSKLVSELTIEGQTAYRTVYETSMKFGGFKKVFIPNGRFPHQKMAAFGASFANRDTEVFHYEKGEPPCGMYLRPYAPQDRLKSQNDALAMTSQIPVDEIHEVATQWLIRRIDPKSNEFSSLWDVSTDNKQKFSRPPKGLMTIFTSSQDEFVALGPEWQRHEWSSQFEGIEAMIQIAYNLQMSVMIRVHPNLTSKAHAYFQSEMDALSRLQVQFPELKIYWPDDLVNSYEILKNSDVCVVWDSTIGLEASAIGIPTYCLATSRYGLVADTREILSKNDIPKSDLTWEVNRRGAERFINYLINRDVRITCNQSTWTDWDSAKEPLVVKLSRITVAGGFPNLSSALRAQIDVYRHRKLRVNVKAMKRSQLITR